jgi:TPR repeat protein
MSKDKSDSHAELLRDAIANYEKDEMSIAVEQFMNLAKNHCEEAFLYLSLIFREGDGVKKDELAAARYKRQYVQIIEANAVEEKAGYKLKLAYLLQFGDGTAVDDARSFSLFLELATEGCGEAQFHLSRIFARGECGQAEDSELEMHWLKEATRTEWPIAIYYTALCLESSSNTVESLYRVVELMERSSQLGCWQAREYLRVHREVPG